MSTNFARTLVWNTTVTSQTTLTKYTWHHLPLNEPPHEKFLRTPLMVSLSDQAVIPGTARPLHASGFGRTLANSIAFKTHCGLMNNVDEKRPRANRCILRNKKAKSGFCFMSPFHRIRSKQNQQIHPLFRYSSLPRIGTSVIECQQMFLKYTVQN